ncbi:MAG: glycosyltransferase [Gemmatimonadales bacterium]
MLTICHSYVVAQNQRVPAMIAGDPRIELTLAAPQFHYGDLRRITLEKTTDPEYEIVPLSARLTRWNQVFWYDHGRLTRLLRDGGFDVVHAWEEPYTYAGYQIARAVGPTRSRFAFRTAQSLVKRYPWPFSAFERRTVARADGWIAGGHLVYEAMTRKGFPAAAGRVITLGVDMDAFRPATDEERTRVRAALGLEAPVVGFVGRLAPAKGLDVLMAALERVTHPWTLLVLGSGPHEATIRRWAHRHDWSDRVRIRLTTHDEVPTYLGVMDLLVAPSRTTPTWKEQFGRMVIEAFACRVPVIGSDSGEIPRVIGDAGVVVPETDVGAWARAIEALLAEESRRRTLAERGYQRCRARYDIRPVAAQYVEFYHALCTREPSP